MGPRRERARESEAPLLPFEAPPRDTQARADAAERGAPRRVFLGWKRPVLHSAADWILRELGHELGDVLVAVPGARAARRLRELLAERAPLEWIPPRVLTQGELVDELVHLERPAAGRLVRTLVWERVLDGLPAAEREKLQRRRPGAGEARERLRLAETVRALHGELAPEGLDFEKLAQSRWEALDSEAERWRVLAHAQAAYRKHVAALGLVDPHEGRAQAIAAGAVDRERRIVLVAVADMNHLLARLIEAVAARVSVLVAAPEELSATFDAQGRLRTEAWSARDLPLALADWRVAEKPVDQAETVRAVLDEWHGELAPEELVLGVADDSVIPYLERQLEDCGVRARRAAGTALERARPVRLLKALARFLARQSFAELAALARDPDLAGAVGGDRDAPARFDRYHVQHLPRRVGDWLGTEDADQAVREFHGRLVESLGALCDGRARPLGEWAAPIRAWLGRVYARPMDETREPERVLAEALRHVGAALGELEEVSGSLELAALGAPEALELLLRVLRGSRVPPPPAEAQPGAVELVGWLDLPLDDAPALVVTGFNEGRVPESLRADAFLPDSRRAAIGLPSDRARLARDVYAATVVLATRARRVFVTGRRSAEGDPLVPSRLAFHVPPAEVPERVTRFLPQGDHVHARLAGDDDAGKRFACPVLPGWTAPTRLRVSAFKTYLDSPYRFYLEHVLGLDTVDDSASELEPRHFGTLAHATLEDLANGPKDSADAAEVGAFLVERLRVHAREQFGTAPLPAVALQLAQLELRLRTFGARQAARAAEGWRIHRVEWKPPAPVSLDVDGTPVELSGKIDRVDVHRDGRRWAILDYKTGNRQRSPRDAHRKKDREKSWIDLQLPLYRLLARGLGLPGEPELGYGWIGKEEHETDFFFDDFEPAELDEALEEARRVVRCVRAGEFAHAGRPPYDEIYKAIFGLSTLGEGEESE